VDDPKLVEGRWQVSDISETPDFVQKFKTKTGREPLIGAAFMYDALKTLATAYYSLPQSQRPSSQQLAQALRSMTIQSSYGTSHFDAQGILHIGAGLYRFENGKQVPVTIEELKKKLGK